MSILKEYIENVKRVWNSRHNKLKDHENLALKDTLEAEFYDRLAQRYLEDIERSHFQYDPDEEMPSRYRHLYSQLSDVAGKRVLDVCCGFGENSVRLAKLGAEVHSIDISPVMIEVTRKNAAYNEVSHRINPARMSAQVMSYSDNCFDLVVGLGALHHLNMESAAREIRRVLKRGGTGIFLEPRVPFPFLIYLRGLMPLKCHESPGGAQLENAEINLLSHFFSSVKRQHFMFLEKLIRLPVIQKQGRLMEEIDTRIARFFPGLNSLFWSVVIKVVK